MTVLRRGRRFSNNFDIDLIEKREVLSDFSAEINTLKIARVLSKTVVLTEGND